MAVQRFDLPVESFHIRQGPVAARQQKTVPVRVRGQFCIRAGRIGRTHDFIDILENLNSVGTPEDRRSHCFAFSSDSCFLAVPLSALAKAYYATGVVAPSMASSSTAWNGHGFAKTAILRGLTKQA